MKINTKRFRVPPGKNVKLAQWPTMVKPFCKTKEEYENLLGKNREELGALQELHYACDRYALLLIFQGMDSAGKDGAIAHVMSGVNPQGCEVSSFKQPSAEELKHDFLWRATCRLPGRGKIGIFNRSYYEEVLVVRVHPELLRNEGLADEMKDPKTLWEERKRFLARIDDAGKNWKFSLADIQERQYWHDYEKAYGDCLQATSTHQAPWDVVPADDKKNARLIIARILLDALGGLKLHPP